LTGKHKAIAYERERQTARLKLCSDNQMIVREQIARAGYRKSPWHFVARPTGEANRFGSAIEIQMNCDSTAMYFVHSYARSRVRTSVAYLVALAQPPAAVFSGKETTDFETLASNEFEHRCYRTGYEIGGDQHSNQSPRKYSAIED
jgi:hypothetical protein